MNVPGFRDNLDEFRALSDGVAYWLSEADGALLRPESIAGEFDELLALGASHMREVVALCGFGVDVVQHMPVIHEDVDGRITLTNVVERLTNEVALSEYDKEIDELQVVPRYIRTLKGLSDYYADVLMHPGRAPLTDIVRPHQYSVVSHEGLEHRLVMHDLTFPVNYHPKYEETGRVITILIGAESIARTVVDYYEYIDSDVLRGIMANLGHTIRESSAHSSRGISEEVLFSWYESEDAIRVVLNNLHDIATTRRELAGFDEL
jgi:hypothetical protein